MAKYGLMVLCPKYTDEALFSNNKMYPGQL